MAVAGAVEIDLIAKVAKLETDLNQATRHLTKFEANTTKSLAKVRDFAMAANGSMEKIIRLSPQLMGVAAAVGAVGFAFKEIYERNGNLQASAGKLGESWDRLVISIGNILPLEKAGRAMEWIADKVNALSNKLSGVTENGQQQALSDKQWKAIQEKADANYKAYEDEKKQIADIANKKAALILKQQEDSKKAIESAKSDYEKIWESTLSAEQALALKFNEDTNKAVEYMKLQPQEKQRVIETLLAMEAKYQEDLAKIKGDRGFGMSEEEAEKTFQQYKTFFDRVTAEQEAAAAKRLAIAEQENRDRFNVASGMTANLATLMQSGSKREFEIGKQAAKATAVIKGIEAIQSSYAAGAKVGGPVLGAAFAATAAIATKMNVDAIGRQSFGGGGSLPTTSGGVPTTVPTDIPSERNNSQGRSVTVQIVGNIYSVNDFRKAVADALKDATNADMIVISGDDGQRMSVA